jgi:hypothetical protein
MHPVHAELQVQIALHNFHNSICTFLPHSNETPNAYILYRNHEFSEILEQHVFSIPSPKS